MWQRIKNYYHLAQALAAQIFYGFPARRIKIIGVTGTDGKTTTVSIIYHILNSSGHKAAMITSIGAFIGNHKYDIGFHVTTPSSWGLQRFIKAAADAGNEYLILETTSHALDQNRVWGIRYEIGVITNITHEHLDYHKTYSTYVRAKSILLNRSRVGIINRDDPSYTKILPFISPSRTVLTYSLSDSRADFLGNKLVWPSPLIGKFNEYNVLAAAAACSRVGITTGGIRKALKSFNAPPGRLETVYDRDFRVIIDFAHTPNSFAQVLPELRKITNGRLIHVFGSAARRDRSKRPLMGRESAKYADIIILTAEDPRDEPVDAICREIASGFGKEWNHGSGNMNYESRIKDKTYFIITDRKDAIEKALNMARKSDMVLLTGKAHEKSINYGYGEQPWDEYKVVKDNLPKTAA